jgi:hypothetical protein
MPSFDYTVVSRVHVAVHGNVAPTDREWQGYLAHIGKNLSEVDAIVAYTMGGGPNHAQRSQSVEFWKTQPKQPPIAVITPSMLVVRMAGALRWFMPSQIKAFGINDLAGAFDYLRLSESQRESALETITLLKRRLSLAPAG